MATGENNEGPGKKKQHRGLAQQILSRDRTESFSERLIGGGKGRGRGECEKGRETDRAGRAKNRRA